MTRKHRIITLGHQKILLRLEPIMWAASDEICTSSAITLGQFCQEVDQQRGTVPLAPAIRRAVIAHDRELAAARTVPHTAAVRSLRAVATDPATVRRGNGHTRPGRRRRPGGNAQSNQKIAITLLAARKCSLFAAASKVIEHAWCDKVIATVRKRRAHYGPW